ncbi:NAD(P)/FAD-dependent oxidoreductase [Streptomonospora wellingtoniae]|uniref:FAD-dependent oxidoreductase n=1 Tax=Streptomonospora wellingtoniae TaxID=3075544 RepID=A0ABU2KN55_9ACTN|nr:FAD-dependent oxidoreductase [Streptomonospora sp. DSM 45055]MDT0300656.1 FAD-dependent oxidoreductase [Streptomonospora sp. DSM 45055]
MNGASKPEHVAVVGAGMVGLSTAWFLQEHGVGVTVLDRTGTAAEASWGNAGLLAPAFTLPLPEPALLRSGLASLFDRSSPVSVPLAPDRRLWAFMAAFARNCAPDRWKRAMAVFDEVNRVSLEAYDRLAESGIGAPVKSADPLLVACTCADDRRHVVEEFAAVRRAGGEVSYDLATGDELRALEPSLSANVHTGLRVHGQRFLNPPEFVHALAGAVRARGGRIVDGFDVTAVRDLGSSGVALAAASGRELRADATVLASGVRLESLARPFGVRTRVQAGRGYSFSVRPRDMPTRPVYFPAQRVACNPLGDRFRITGMMEFRSPDAPLNPQRISTIVESVRPLMSGVDFAAREEEWVGSRPCTPDGLPLIGASSSPRVHIAGGHGMWGIVLGPLTGRLLAESMATGRSPALLRRFDPLR